MFGRSDFSHARLSILVVLPLCSLFAIYLAELKTIPISNALTQLRSAHPIAIALGIVFSSAILSWLIHGPIIDQLVAKTAFHIRAYQASATIMPPVAVKAVLTAVILAAVLAGLLLRPHRAFDGRVAATIVVATFAFVETVTYAHFKVNGSQNWTYPVPFGSLSYMDVPTTVMRPPNEEKVAAFAEKLQVQDFRSILVSQQSFYAGPLTPHISQFWHARMVGGYGAGVPTRLSDLPWPKGVSTLRMIELRGMSNINPFLLALLNVKYLLVLTPNLYFNTLSENWNESMSALGGITSPAESVNIGGILFGLVTNSIAPLPRHFFVANVTGVEETPRMHGEALEARTRPAASKSQDGTGDSVLSHVSIDQLTSNSLAEDFGGTQKFDTSGSLVITYHDDKIDIRVTSSSQDRFVVINERYHPNWRAHIEANEVPIFPTNAVMMGIRVPANCDRIQLHFVPFSSALAARTVLLLSFLIFLAAIGTFWLMQKRLRRQTP